MPRSDTSTSRTRLAAEARNRALRRLAAAHRGEFDALYDAERAKVDLPPLSNHPIPLIDVRKQPGRAKIPVVETSPDGGCLHQKVWLTNGGMVRCSACPMVKAAGSREWRLP